MKKAVLAILALAALLTACEKAPASTEATNNPAVPVSRLFNFEGCTVYRFEDSGRMHYYTRCDRGDVSTSTRHTEHCGKGCTQIRYSTNTTTEHP